MSAFPQLDAAWRQWITENVDRGCARGALIEHMAAAGWSPTLAPAIIDQVLREREILASSVPVPAPALEDRPSLVHVGGRDVRVLLTAESPRLAVFGGLLADDECDALIEQARSRIGESTVVDAASGENVPDQARTSRGMFFKFGETPLVAEIEARLALGHRWPEAARPYTRSALRTALVPQIETTKAVGLVFLPGAMTGLVLAGVDAVDAVTIQLALMYLVLGSVATSVTVIGLGLTRQLFTSDHRLRRLDRRAS